MLAALLLADGRLPTGGHVHSAGVESAVSDGRVHDVASLAAYVRGRLHTVGLTEASVAAAAVLHPHELVALDAEAEARIPVPDLRAVSRRLGRQLLRVAGACWPDASARSPRDDPHQPVALGVVAAAAGVPAHQVAALAVHHAVATPAQAALRLLGLDPFGVAAVLASLADEGALVAAEAVAAAGGPIRDLPARSGPIVEIAAAHHQRLDGRLFAS